VLYAQVDQNGRWFLLHPATGEIMGTIAPSYRDAASFVFNPAYTALTEDSIEVKSSYGRIRWPFDFVRGKWDQPSYAVTLAGYLPKRWSHVPVSIGAGALSTRIDLGENTWADGSGGPPVVTKASESVNGYALALAMRSVVDLSLGLNLKRFRSVLGPAALGGRANTNQWEAGCLLHIPLARFFPKEKNHANHFIRWQADFDLGAVYPLKEAQLKYANSDAVDYLPRSFNSGWQIKAVMLSSFRKKYLPFLAVGYGGEMNILRDFKDTGSREREWKTGKFNFMNNFIFNKPVQGIDTRSIFHIGFMNLFQYQNGTWQRKDRKTQRFYSYVFYSRGLFDLLKLSHLPDLPRKIIDYFDILIAQTTYRSPESDKGSEITKTGFSFMIHLTY